MAAATRNVLRAPGLPLDAITRAYMEPRFGCDLGGVRIHADRDAALASKAVGAAAFASGWHIGFAGGRYEPVTSAGRALLAHELAHVVQQTSAGARGAGHSEAALEAEADRAADAVTRGSDAPPLSAAGGGVQRRVELRDAVPGNTSGFGRRQELVARLNAVSTALTFRLLPDGALAYTPRPAGTETEFDKRIRQFIDDPTVLPLLLAHRVTSVDADAWQSGMVDVADMLRSDDLGFELVLLHFLAERRSTRAYAARINRNLIEGSLEFSIAHRIGVDAEVRLLQDFLADPSVMLVRDGVDPELDPPGVFRSYTNARGDRIRARTPSPVPAADTGIERNFMDVLVGARLVITPAAAGRRATRALVGGTEMTMAAYRALLRREQMQALSKIGGVTGTP